MVIQSLEEGELEETAIIELCTEQMSEEMVRVLFAGIRVLVTLALRQPGLKPDVSTYMHTSHCNM